MPRQPILIAALVASACLACPPSSPQDSATEPDTTGGPLTTTDSPGTTSPTTGADATTATPVVCGDGLVTPDETCDDGNGVNGDGCNNDCRPSAELLLEYLSATRGSDRIRSIAVDEHGIVVGAGAPGLVRSVARFDLELTPQWSKNYGESSIGVVTGVTLAPDAIYAAGAVFSDADGHDIWFARLALDGTLVWEDIVASGFGDDYLNQVALDPDGDLVVTGLATNSDDQTSLWTRKYAPDGSPLWTAAEPLGNKYNIYPLGPGLTLTPDSAVVGWNIGGGNLSNDRLVAYPLSGGAPLWTSVLPDTHGVIFGLARDSTGDLLLAVIQDANMVVRRTTSTGTLLWSSDACTGRQARAVAIDSQGDIVAIGDGEAAVGSNIRLCKFTAEGVLRWGKDIDGGFGDDRGYAVAIGPSDRIFAGGWQAVGPADDDAWLAVFAP